MAFNETYRSHVSLLVRCLPIVGAEDCFALKGGTAINLFVRNLPRLSVDIDLTYVPVRPRQESLADIDAAMVRIGERVTAGIPEARVVTNQRKEGAVTKLFVRAGGAQIKIEVTSVLRGCAYEPELRETVPLVEETFGFAEMRVVSFADLYGGKIVAALDRQHPRDLFDVRGLLANEGIDEALRRAFVVYLLSHDRPMIEVLAGRPKDIEPEYERGFAGMTSEPVSLEELTAARDALIARVVGEMPDRHRQFLVSFERGEPEWSLLGVDGAESLPAIGWRQLNLDRLEPAARADLVARLEDFLLKPAP